MRPYCFQGGVGKSTLTRELAATMSKLGYNVGIIDCDPQCNITSFLLGGQQLNWREEPAGPVAIEDVVALPVPVRVPQVGHWMRIKAAME